MILKPGDPSYDAHAAQMNKIYKDQGPDAWKKDLTPEEITKLEDEMDESESDKD